jgi:hypothetical protein
MVFVIDELADLMMTNKEVEGRSSASPRRHAPWAST